MHKVIVLFFLLSTVQSFNLIAADKEKYVQQIFQQHQEIKKLDEKLNQAFVDLLKLLKKRKSGA